MGKKVGESSWDRAPMCRCGLLGEKGPLRQLFSILEHPDRKHTNRDDLGSYWDPPTNATFQQLIQVEIDWWTHITLRTVGTWALSEMFTILWTSPALLPSHEHSVSHFRN